MKKVLFATTALIATAGVASADVSISGYAEMGIFGGDTIDAAGTDFGTVTQRETQFHQDIDVTFSMSLTTDTGLNFGTAIDLDEATNQNSANDAWAANGAMQNNAAHGGVSMFVRGGFGTITLGDTDGALDARTAEVPAGPGSIQDAQENAVWAKNSGLDGEHDGQILRFDLPSMNGVNVTLSYEMDDTQGATQAGAVWGVGASFSAGGVNFGVGYQDGEESATVDADAVAFSVGGTVGAISYGLMYVSEDRSDWTQSEDMYQIGAAYTAGAWSMGASYGEVENEAGVANNDVEALSITAGYDLGGGAKFLIGFNDTTANAAGTKTDAQSFDAGIAMSF